MPTEKNLGQFTKNYKTFYPKITKLVKIWVWDPGTEILDPEKTYSGSRTPDPGAKKAPDPGSGFATLLQRAQKYRHLFSFVSISLPLLDPDPYKPLYECGDLKGCLEVGEVGHEGGLLQLQLPQLALQLRRAAGLLRLAVEAVQVLLVFLTQRKTTPENQSILTFKVLHDRHSFAIKLYRKSLKRIRNT
jgi:hypothetical protein